MCHRTKFIHSNRGRDSKYCATDALELESVFVNPHCRALVAKIAGCVDNPSLRFSPLGSLIGNPVGQRSTVCEWILCVGSGDVVPSVVT